MADTRRFGEPQRQLDLDHTRAADVNELLRETERELMLARQKLELANRSRSEFLSKLSHELRTPMTAIVGMTDLLLLGELTGEQRECLATVRDAADSLMSILTDVCDYARVEAGTLEFEWTGFRLRPRLAEVARKLAPAAEAKGIELIMRVDADVPDLLVTDPARLGQIVSNLIDSGIRLTKEGEVFLDVRRLPAAADEVLLKFTVRDTGTGIASEDHARLFVPFMSSSNATRRRYPLGPMGLPLTAALATALGGQLTMHSELGSRTCFEATVRALRQSAEFVPFEPAGHETLQGVEALIVAPNATARRVLEEMTSGWGLHVTAAPNLEAALAELQVAAVANKPFSIAIIDGSVDRAGLAQIQQELQRLAAGAAALLVLTSSRQTLDSRQCAELGVSATLRKPVLEHELLETLVTCVRGINVERQVAAQAPDASPLRVLLVEGAAANRAVTARLLEKHGHSVSAVSNGVEALERLNAGDFGLVLVDRSLPDAEDVARAASRRDVPIVFMACGDHAPAASEPTLARPLDAAELYRAIAAVCCGADPPGDVDAAFEIDAAIARLGGDVDLYNELVQCFLDDTSGLLGKIQRAIDNRDADALHRGGHSLKGLAASCGALGVADAAARIERRGREKNLDDVAGFWGDLQQAFDQARRRLGAFRVR